MAVVAHETNRLRPGDVVAEEGVEHNDLTADRRLAERVLQGDEPAFEELVRRHHRQVSRICGRFFRRREIAEEVAQEVYVKAFLGMRSYRAEMPLEHWLSRIAVNACYDQLRRKRERLEVSVSEIAEEPAVFFERLKQREDATDYWEREDVRLYAEQLLSRMAPAERLVLTLLTLEEMSVTDVAKMTGWSTANVKIRAFRARSRLRKLMSDLPGQTR